MKSTRLARDSFDRRVFLIGSGVLLAGALTGAARKAWPAQLTAGPALIEDVVAANRILAALEIVDGYGHVSARHDKDPNHYLIARSVAPELVTASDILDEGEAIKAEGFGGYERAWELWKRKAMGK